MSSDDIPDLIRQIMAKRAKRYKERKETLKIFKDDAELQIVSSLVSTVIKKGYHLVIYDVENFENLFAYADVFSRLASVPHGVPFGKYDASFLAVTEYPSEEDIYSFIVDANREGTRPIVGFFVGDFLPNEAVSSSPTMKDIMQSISLCLFRRIGYFIMFTTNPVLLYDNIPMARYGVVMRDLATAIVTKKYPEKAEYAEVVGFDKVASMSREELREYIRTRKLPAPHTLEEVQKDVGFEKMILPHSLREFLRINILSVLQKDFKAISSILLLGPPGVGKTTLGYAIAEVLGVPAYVVRVELMGSKWLGETEKIANQTILLANDRAPIVLIFRDAELILAEKGEGGEESMVYTRVRSIISTWLRSKKRRFFAVFTISDPSKLPDYLLYDTTFGEFKLPMLPPLTLDERKAMISLFLSMEAEKHGLEFDPLDPSVDEALTAVAEETWGYTARELRVIARTAVNILLYKGGRRIDKEVIQLAKKFKEIDRVSRVELMKETVKAGKKAGMPEPLLVELYRFEEEVEKLRARAMMEESKKKSMAKLSV